VPAKTIRLRLINQLGQLVRTIELNGGNRKVCAGDLAGGVYFLTGMVDEKPVKRKLIIDK